VSAGAVWLLLARRALDRRINPLNNSIKVVDERHARSSSGNNINADASRLLAAFNNFNSSFYETCRSRVVTAAPVASLTADAAADCSAAAADETEAGTTLSGLAHCTHVTPHALLPMT